MDLFEPLQTAGGRLFLFGEGCGLLVDVLEQPSDDTDEKYEDQVEGDRRRGVDQRVPVGQRHQGQQRPGEDPRGEPGAEPP
jgi:hypothetical protein